LLCQPDRGQSVDRVAAVHVSEPYRFAEIIEAIASDRRVDDELE